MRASEFVLEATKPTDPPPVLGSPDFNASRAYFTKIIRKSIKDFNDELKFLYTNNRPVYDNKINDQDKLRTEVTNTVIDDLLKVGAGNFVTNNKALFSARFKLNSTNAPFDSATKSVNVNDNPINSLSLDATTTWYANRYARFTNPKVFAKLQGKQESQVTTKVMSIEASVGRQLTLNIGVNPLDPTFWNKLRETISDTRKRKTVYRTLHTVYAKSGYKPVNPAKVLPLDSRAANEFESVLGIVSVDDLDFWFEFTNKLDKSPDKLISIFNTYYP